MIPSRVLWLGTAALAVPAVWLALRLAEPTPIVPPPAPADRGQAGPAAPTASSLPAAEGRAAAGIPESTGAVREPAPPSQTEAPPAITDVSAILSRIDEASTRYDPSALPVLQPYLLHEDEEVRTAAVDGIIALGEAGGAPLLRAASAQLKDPREAVAYLDAAEYLELPPVTMEELKQEMAAAARARDPGEAKAGRARVAKGKAGAAPPFLRGQSKSGAPRSPPPPARPAPATSPDSPP